MALQTLNNNESGLSFRTKLNNNFKYLNDADSVFQTQINDINASPYTHQQNTATAVWPIPHNLGVRLVSVQIIDGGGSDALADIDYTSENIVTLTFSIPITGTAIIRR